jgi:hypothetical protein
MRRDQMIELTEQLAEQIKRETTAERFLHDVSCNHLAFLRAAGAADTEEQIDQAKVEFAEAVMKRLAQAHDEPEWEW